MKKCCNYSFIIPPVLWPDRTGCMWEKPLWKTGSIVTRSRGNLALGWISPVLAYSPGNIHLSAEQEEQRDAGDDLVITGRNWLPRWGTLERFCAAQWLNTWAIQRQFKRWCFSSRHYSIAFFSQLQMLTEGLGSKLSKSTSDPVFTASSRNFPIKKQDQRSKNVCLMFIFSCYDLSICPNFWMREKTRQSEHKRDDFNKWHVFATFIRKGAQAQAKGRLFISGLFTDRIWKQIIGRKHK